MVALQAQEARTLLPQVRTYVLEGSDIAKRMTSQGHEGTSTTSRPMALTLQNVSMHNTFLARRQEREKARLRRAELERRTGLHAQQYQQQYAEGGGSLWSQQQQQDTEVRMRRWLLDMEHQQQHRDIGVQPLTATFKVAIMPTA